MGWGNTLLSAGPCQRTCCVRWDMGPCHSCCWTGHRQHAWEQASGVGCIPVQWLCQGCFLSPPRHTLPCPLVPELKSYRENHPQQAGPSTSLALKIDRCLTPGTLTPDHTSARCSCQHLAHTCSQAARLLVIPRHVHAASCIPQGCFCPATGCWFLGFVPANL